MIDVLINMNKRLAVCVPYRDRKKHLDIFVPYLSDFLTKKGIDHKIFICHQADNKQFNRGMIKNIAFREACKEGFDYFAFHDIDMLPEDDSCDYSFPGTHPVHLCALRSDEGYKLSYREYFGGCVLFSKEQFHAVNGYYNGYWGWGYEDDDLYFRTERKGLTDVRYLTFKKGNRNIVRFNTGRSYISVPRNRSIKKTDINGYSLFLFIKPEADENNDYLLGEGFGFFEVPLWFTGSKNIISYNKYESFVAKPFKKIRGFDVLYSSWPKNEWAMLFLVVDRKNRRINLFLNGTNVPNQGKDVTQLFAKAFLYQIADKKIIIGNNPLLNTMKAARPFRGEIAEVCMWDTVLSETDIHNKLHGIGGSVQKNNIVFQYDFSAVHDNLVPDNGPHHNHGELHDCSVGKLRETKIKIHSAPFRRLGRFTCLPHINEGVVRRKLFNSHDYKLKSAAAINEKIFKMQVKKNAIDPDQYGLNSLRYTLHSRHTIFSRHTILNVECRHGCK